LVGLGKNNFVQEIFGGFMGLFVCGDAAGSPSFKVADTDPTDTELNCRPARTAEVKLYDENTSLNSQVQNLAAENAILKSDNQRLQSFYEKNKVPIVTAQLAGIFINRHTIGSAAVAAITSKLLISSGSTIASGAKPLFTIGRSGLTKGASVALGGTLLVGTAINAGLSYWDYQQDIANGVDATQARNDAIFDTCVSVGGLVLGTAAIAAIGVTGAPAIVVGGLVSLGAYGIGMDFKEYLERDPSSSINPGVNGFKLPSSSATPSDGPNQ